VLSYVTLRINVRVGSVSSEASWSYMFFIEHRFCSGPLDRKSSDLGDRIGVGAVEGFVGWYSAERSARVCQVD
jgi:hypothetical protein